MLIYYAIQGGGCLSWSLSISIQSWAFLTEVTRLLGKIKNLDNLQTHFVRRSDILSVSWLQPSAPYLSVTHGIQEHLGTVKQHILADGVTLVHCDGWVIQFCCCGCLQSYLQSRDQNQVQYPRLQVIYRERPWHIGWKWHLFLSMSLLSTVYKL